MCRTDYESNTNGRVIKITGGLTIKYVYDTMGTWSTTYPVSSAEVVLHDALNSDNAGHVVKTKDRVNTDTYFEYNDSGRLTTSTDGAAIGSTNILDD